MDVLYRVWLGRHFPMKNSSQCLPIWRHLRLSLFEMRNEKSVGGHNLHPQQEASVIRNKIDCPTIYTCCSAIARVVPIPVDTYTLGLTGKTVTLESADICQWMTCVLVCHQTRLWGILVISSLWRSHLTWKFISMWPGDRAMEKGNWPLKYQRYSGVYMRKLSTAKEYGVILLDPKYTVPNQVFLLCILDFRTSIQHAVLTNFWIVQQHDIESCGMGIPFPNTVSIPCEDWEAP